MNQYRINNLSGNGCQSIVSRGDTPEDALAKALSVMGDDRKIVQVEQGRENSATIMIQNGWRFLVTLDKINVSYS